MEPWYQGNISLGRGHASNSPSNFKVQILFLRACLHLTKTGPLWQFEQPGLRWEDFTTGRYSAYIGFPDWTMSESLIGNSDKYRDINYAKVAKDEEGLFHDIAILVLTEEVVYSNKIR